VGRIVTYVELVVVHARAPSIIFSARTMSRKAFA
jgi:hypothetical protein